MKNFRTVLLLLLTLATAHAAKTDTPESIYKTTYNGKAYIFIEGGVEFSVFADGQFDFVYLGPQHNTLVHLLFVVSHHNHHTEDMPDNHVLH